ncbi:SPOR domain-containing protein [Cognatilysobacter tabacisoli]|uniref:SPOR domain-containing protein n=1 Tax=Cognatilysobacter tabacisoli TaxID=2315424 RepID=UPI000E6AE805|nr:SPOR domain-containing protein [Lysobacter tabacisoli]
MEPALKQRLIGATVLVALAVVFLPMLIKGPAPESSASDVPLELPDAPQGQFETRELPLVGPGEAPAAGAVGMPGAPAADPDTLPMVDTAAAGAQPATAAAGDYAVNFGSYASTADAARVIAALAGAQLAAFQQPVTDAGRTLHRVRIGPFATRAEAEAARLRAAKVNDRVTARVVALDADASTPAAATAAPVASQPAPAPTASVSAPVPLPESKPAATQPVAPAPKPAAPKPVATAPAKPVEAPKPAAALGFAVQLGAFGNAAEATKLRDRARAAGFSAFVEAVPTDKGTLNRVRVGPVASRAEADALKAQLSSKLGVSGIVRPHP